MCFLRHAEGTFQQINAFKQRVVSILSVILCGCVSVSDPLFCSSLVIISAALLPVFHGNIQILRQTIIEVFCIFYSVIQEILQLMILHIPRNCKSNFLCYVPCFLCSISGWTLFGEDVEVNEVLFLLYDFNIGCIANFPNAFNLTEWTLYVCKCSSKFPFTSRKSKQAQRKSRTIEENKSTNRKSTKEKVLFSSLLKGPAVLQQDDTFTNHGREAFI